MVALRTTPRKEKEKEEKKEKRRMMMRNVKQKTKKRKQLQQIHSPCNVYAPPACATAIAILRNEKNIFRAKCFKNSVR